MLIGRLRQLLSTWILPFLLTARVVEELGCRFVSKYDRFVFLGDYEYALVHAIKKLNVFGDQLSQFRMQVSHI